LDGRNRRHQRRKNYQKRTQPAVGHRFRHPLNTPLPQTGGPGQALIESDELHAEAEPSAIWGAD
jgi:hypothetical protein